MVKIQLWGYVEFCLPLILAKKFGLTEPQLPCL